MPTASAPREGQPSAEAFTAQILAAATDEQRLAYGRYFPGRLGEPGQGDHFVGTRMGTIFDLAKGYTTLPVGELEAMLDSDVHEVRVGALKAMGLSAAAKKANEDRRRELYELYLRRHDRINDWDLVDLAAGPVIGGWLMDRDRTPLRELAASADTWERRTAIVATIPFVRAKQLDDTYEIAGLLLHDPEDLVQKATGWLLRYAGDLDRDRLLAFLDANAAGMPRVSLRATIEKLPPEQRKHYLSLESA